MNLRTFIERPILSAVISISIVVVGIIGLFTLPVEQYPDIAPPTIQVSTSYFGASAETLQKSVIAPLEEAINGVENMTYMTSTASNAGVVDITVYFKQGTDPDMAAVNVQNRVSKATGQLPAEVTQVGVTTSKRQTSILQMFSLYSPGDSYDEKFLSNYISINLKPAILRIQGVGDMMIMRILKPEAGRSKLDHKVYGRVYADGNIMEGYPAITEDNWAGGIQIETQPNTDGYTENMRSNRPFEMPYIRITSAHDAYDFVLKNAGANIPCRDIVDERIVEEVRTGVPYYDKKMAKDANGDLTGLAPKSMGEDGQFKYRRLPKDSYKQGIITDIRQMGGYPEYKGTPYVDTDGDGMPDEWEKANGLNPNDPSDANKDCTGDGYTNIEKYINGISTRNCIDWSDLRNNYDTLASKGKLM